MKAFVRLIVPFMLVLNSCLISSAGDPFSQVCKSDTCPQKGANNVFIIVLSSMPLFLLLLLLVAVFWWMWQSKDFSLSKALSEKRRLGLGELADTPSTSRLVLFLSGLATVVISVSISSFYICYSLWYQKSPDLEPLGNVLVLLGMGIVPYAVNKFTQPKLTSPNFERPVSIAKPLQKRMGVFTRHNKK